MSQDSERWGERARSRLERILTQNIVPFWHPQTLDKEKGGYHLNHDVDGNPREGGTKMIVTQARMIWYFSRLYDSGWGGEECLQAAEHGYSFLRDYMWDKENGGFYWQLDSEGKVLRSNKHMYGQAFGLYSLSEYATASKSKEALSLAQRMFGLMEEHAHDGDHGGYNEFFLSDWSPAAEAGHAYLGYGSGAKRMNTHLHMLEALITYYKATGDQLGKDRLNELIFVLSNSVARFGVGACTELYRRDWRPVHGPEHDRISYGHNLENIWLLIEACNAVGIPNDLLANYYRSLFDYSVRFGFDQQNGGVYDSGPINEPADRLGKVWWVEAEALVSMIYMYLLAGDEVCREYFSRQLDWIDRHQVDWKNGDWFNTILPDGTPIGNKADMWKSAYHNGRAMIEVLEVLKD